MALYVPQAGTGLAMAGVALFHVLGPLAAGGQLLRYGFLDVVMAPVQGAE
ncbi:hypothetical protein [Thiohalorhabdus sp.]